MPRKLAHWKVALVALCVASFASGCKTGSWTMPGANWMGGWWGSGSTPSSSSLAGRANSLPSPPSATANPRAGIGSSQYGRNVNASNPASAGYAQYPANGQQTAYGANTQTGAYGALNNSIQQTYQAGHQSVASGQQAAHSAYQTGQSAYQAGANAVDAVGQSVSNTANNFTQAAQAYRNDAYSGQATTQPTTQYGGQGDQLWAGGQQQQQQQALPQQYAPPAGAAAQQAAPGAYQGYGSQSLTEPAGTIPGYAGASYAPGSTGRGGGAIPGASGVQSASHANPYVGGADGATTSGAGSLYR